MISRLLLPAVILLIHHSLPELELQRDVPQQRCVCWSIIGLLCVLGDCINICEDLRITSSCSGKSVMNECS